jgi:hypothetical protein
MQDFGGSKSSKVFILDIFIMFYYKFIHAFWLSLLYFIPFTLSGQRYISGHITDAADGVPIPGAAVFIDNTTAGTTTDTAGYYRLKMPGEGSYRLAVSHVAYLPVFRDIETGKASEIMDIALQIREMEDVEVAVKVKARKDDIDLFWKTILGKKPSKKTIYAANPNDVYYYYNSETQKLTVSCRVPLQIVNYETGYHIQCVLHYFTHDYKNDLSSWEEQCMFKELEPENYKQKELWGKNRKKVCQVSIAKFIKSLYDNTTLDNGFLLTNPDMDPDSIVRFNLTNPGDFLSIDSANRSKTFHVPYSRRRVMLVCFGKPVTGKELQNMKHVQKRWENVGLFRQRLITPEPVYIYPDGTYRNPLRVSSMYSSNSLSGLHMMLPTEYLLAADPVVADAFAKDGRAGDVVPADTGLQAHTLADTLIRAVKRFDMQLKVFPQEKVYLHTDKPYYISGERIWFRAHVVDAASHTPALSANCVYAELFDARDSVICRVKTGPANDMFSGYISIPEDIPEGDYTLRAYTGTMRNLDEDYFFIKNIRIGDPLSRIVQATPEFKFMPDGKIGAGIRFSNARSFTPVTPKSVTVSINSGKPMNVKSDNDVSGVTFNLSSAGKQGVMLLDAKYDRKPYRKYIKIPLPDDDFDVSFYPEGGHLLNGSRGRVAFRAMQRDGSEIDINGIVYDSQGNEQLTFKTDLFGMGVFNMLPKQDETYYAICTGDNGQSKRFDLPVAGEEGHVLSASWFKDNLIVKTLQPESRKTGDTLFLIIHTRGVVQDMHIWENVNEPIVLQKESLPSGVTNLLLLNKDMQPVSERLVFILNDDQAKVTCATDREAYLSRSPVEYTVNITDESGEPLQGSFSVSVTDDHEVSVDTAANILTSLLLSSDLRGNISHPAFYFQKNNRSAAYALDLLMLTQGWRRYDTERIIRNSLMYPDTLLGKGYEISGTVKTTYSSRVEANVDVSILSGKAEYSAHTFTDHNGRFYLHDGDAPDSTVFIVQAVPQSGRNRLDLTMDKTPYPERSIPVAYSDPPKFDVFAKYADKAEQKYVDENGIRMIYLSEVTVTALKKPKRESIFYSADYSITEDEIEKRPPVSMSSLLNRLPDVTATGGEGSLSVYINRFGKDSVPMLLVDDLEMDVDDINRIDVADIAQIDVVKDVAKLAIWGNRARCGVISIFTKRGIPNAPKETRYIKNIMPLGFQKPAGFYAPKYDAPVKNIKPDLRTTIHWQPSLTTDDKGAASFGFYTADAPSTYTVVIEGITDEGKIVYKRDQIVVTPK